MKSLNPWWHDLLVKLRIIYSPSRRVAGLDKHRSLLEVLEQWQRRRQARARRAG